MRCSGRSWGRTGILDHGTGFRNAESYSGRVACAKRAQVSAVEHLVSVEAGTDCGLHPSSIHDAIRHKAAARGASAALAREGLKKIAG